MKQTYQVYLSIVALINISTVNSERKVPPISLYKLNTLISKFKGIQDIHFTKSDRNRGDTNRLNNSIYLNEQKDNDILDIDKWFGDEIQSSMIFVFISCIIASIGFIFLIFLCYKHKLQQAMAYFLTTTPAEANDFSV